MYIPKVAPEKDRIEIDKSIPKMGGSKAKMSTENQIKEYLKQNGISQVHIAKAIEMPEPILSMTLNGKRRLMLEEYALICGALRVNTDFFLKPRLPNGKMKKKH